MSEIMAKTEEIMKKGKALGADEVIATTVFGEYRQLRFSNNQIDIGVAWDDYTTNVLLTWQKRVVATQIKNFQNITPTMEQLFKLAKASKENPMYGGVVQGKFKYAKPMADKSIRDVENPSEYIYEAIAAAQRKIGKNIDAGGILFTKYEQVFLVSSEGPEGQDERSAIELSIRAFAERDESGHGVECNSSLKGFNPARAGEKAGEIAKMAKNPKAGKTGKFDIIFEPLFWGSMLGAYGMMGSAFFVLTKMSVFADKMGQKVGPAIVTIRDNPGKYSVSNRVFDDEGAPVKETVFIDKGVLKTYFHNTSTAKLFKTQTTGHAGLVQPMPWSLEMDAGDMTKDEMFEDTKRGLYVTNTWYTRFQNYATGDFSTIPRDGIFLIENGEIKESWKEIRLSDNILNLLANIAGISKERMHVHWWGEADPPSLSPYVLARNIQITRPE
ncbi:MAG: TldD/PmbA family protein [Candidatus Bathyarchaeia archaeon]|jgi:PmbA protein|nr:TldD/PmbA family protein [Candidatus Bathyarchaeota archaeon A05DMB-4]MDH7595119.1 TldD/PmbA family protein [Candidatus Bathyarchaeota archaeon]